MLARHLCICVEVGRWKVVLSLSENYHSSNSGVPFAFEVEVEVEVS